MMTDLPATARRLLSWSRSYLKQLAKLGEEGYRFSKLGAVERRRLLHLSRAIKLDPRDQEIILDLNRQVDLQNLYSKYMGVRCTLPSRGPYHGKIWQLWYQGEGAAPEIVKCCLASVRKFSGGREIVLLDQGNIDNYTALPGYIHDKKKKGSITNVAFSDVLRACLLAEHGGTWIDATVLLTDSVPAPISSAPLFCFSTTPRSFGRPGNTLASSWFIQAVPQHVIMNAMKDLFIEYWKHENESRHHYYFHLMFALCVSRIKECQDAWEKVPYYSNIPPHVLQWELFNEFNEARFTEIMRMSPIHKLTFYGGSEFQPEKPNTFYRFLVQGPHPRRADREARPADGRAAIPNAPRVR